MFRILTLLTIHLTLASCVSHMVESDEVVPDHLYDLKVEYSNEDKAFLFKLESYADKEICIDSMNWPVDIGGYYTFQSMRINFLYDGVRYGIKKDLNTGYCIGRGKNGCMHIISKGDYLSGRVPIEYFAVPSEIYTSEGFSPQLHYPDQRRYCKTK